VADTFARQRQIVGSTSDWAANNIVLGNGEIGVEVVSSSETKLKVGDGSRTWSALPYASALSNTINAATQAALDLKLSLAGGTMTGFIVLHADPTNDLHPATKQYVDDIDDTLTTSISGKLSTSGGTLTGSLTLNADPTLDLHAATKGYVDDGDAEKLDLAGGTMTGFIILHADPSSAMHAVTKQYVDDGSYQTVVGGSSTYAGKVVKTNSVGKIDSSLLPVAGTYKGAVDVTAAYALPGGYSGGDYFVVSTSGDVDSSWDDKITGSPATAGAGQFLIYNSISGDFDLVGDAVSETAIDGKLDKAGGTMTGFITLHADPTSALHAASKQYADTMLPKAGGTMTGFITLHADPSSAMHAVTKQYVDGVDADIRTDFDAADDAISAAFAAADALQLSLSGGTMTGFITLHADPSSAMQPTTKQYVDGKLAGKITVATSAPSSPAVNDIWVDTN
jgi:hypothetical protein